MTLILIWILLIEFSVILFFISAALIENLYLTAKKNKGVEHVKVLSQIMMEALGKNISPLQLFPKKIGNPDHLLSVLESFSARFQGGRSFKLKEELANHFLLPLARNKVKSLFWDRRHFAARCFALCPQQEDISCILSLIKDPVFLVHSTAALATIRLESPDGLFLMLKKISLEEDNYAKYFYKDLLRQGSSQVFQYIEKQALEEKDERTHLTCLDILSSKVFPVAHELLQRDIASTNSKVRYAALKIYARNPQKESEGILLEAMNSSELESRQEASYGLGLFSSELSLVALKKALGDPCMPVRLQSAKSLKKIGSKGIEILHQQKGQGDHLTSEIANYVLEFS